MKFRQLITADMYITQQEFDCDKTGLLKKIMPRSIKNNLQNVPRRTYIRTYIRRKYPATSL